MLVFYVIWANGNPSFLTERILFLQCKVAHDSFLDFGEPILILFSVDVTRMVSVTVS